MATYSVTSDKLVLLVTQENGKVQPFYGADLSKRLAAIQAQKAAQDAQYAETIANLTVLIDQFNTLSAS